MGLMTVETAVYNSCGRIVSRAGGDEQRNQQADHDTHVTHYTEDVWLRCGELKRVVTGRIIRGDRYEALWCCLKNERRAHAQETEPAVKDLRILRKTVHVASQVGAQLGRCEVLLEALSLPATAEYRVNAGHSAFYTGRVVVHASELLD